MPLSISAETLDSLADFDAPLPWFLPNVQNQTATKIRLRFSKMSELSGFR
jgi:hypothetical protein